MLRAGGLRTVAKTTGSAAAVIHADGSASGGPMYYLQRGLNLPSIEGVAIRPLEELLAYA